MEQLPYIPTFHPNQSFGEQMKLMQRYQLDLHDYLKQRDEQRDDLTQHIRDLQMRANDAEEGFNWSPPGDALPPEQYPIRYIRQGRVKEIYASTHAVWTDLATHGLPAYCTVKPARSDNAYTKTETTSEWTSYIKLNESTTAGAGLIAVKGQVIAYAHSDKWESVGNPGGNFFSGSAIHAQCGDGDYDGDGGALMRLFRFAPNAISKYVIGGGASQTHTVLVTDSQPMQIILIGGGGGGGGSGADWTDQLTTSTDSGHNHTVDLYHEKSGGGGGAGGSVIVALVEAPVGAQFTINLRSSPASNTGAAGAASTDGTDGYDTTLVAASPHSSSELSLTAFGGESGKQGFTSGSPGGLAGAGARSNPTASGTWLKGYYVMRDWRGGNGHPGVIQGDYGQKGLGGGVDWSVGNAVGKGGDGHYGAGSAGAGLEGACIILR